MATISVGWRNSDSTRGAGQYDRRGQASIIQPGGVGNTIGGGAINQTEPSVEYGTLGGGRRNRIGDGSINSTIGGGRNVDADGVAAAAIQGLNDKLEEQANEIRIKDEKLSQLEKRLAALEEMIRPERPWLR